MSPSQLQENEKDVESLMCKYFLHFYIVMSMWRVRSSLWGNHVKLTWESGQGYRESGRPYMGVRSSLYIESGQAHMGVG